MTTEGKLVGGLSNNPIIDEIIQTEKNIGVRTAKIIETFKSSVDSTVSLHGPTDESILLESDGIMYKLALYENAIHSTQIQNKIFEDMFRDAVFLLPIDRRYKSAEWINRNGNKDKIKSIYNFHTKSYYTKMKRFTGDLESLLGEDSIRADIAEAVFLSFFGIDEKLNVLESELTLIGPNFTIENCSVSNDLYTQAQPQILQSVLKKAQSNIRIYLEARENDASALELDGEITEYILLTKKMEELIKSDAAENALENIKVMVGTNLDGQHANTLIDILPTKTNNEFILDLAYIDYPPNDRWIYLSPLTQLGVMSTFINNLKEKYPTKNRFIDRAINIGQQIDDRLDSSYWPDSKYLRKGDYYRIGSIYAMSCIKKAELSAVTKLGGEDGILRVEIQAEKHK